MKFTQMPADAFEHLQLNAGILVDSFTPASQTIGNILGATSNGITFTAKPEFKDYGEDIDNCPKNVKELKKLTKWEAKMTGTFKSVTQALAVQLLGCADIDSVDTTKIIPRNDVLSADFQDVWWVGDYSDVNTGANAGFIAIHLIDALSDGGLSIKSNNESKGDLAFSFVGHYSMADTTKVPFEIFIKQGA